MWHHNIVHGRNFHKAIDTVATMTRGTGAVILSMFAFACASGSATSLQARSDRPDTSSSAAPAHEVVPELRTAFGGTEPPGACRGTSLDLRGTRDCMCALASAPFLNPKTGVLTKSAGETCGEAIERRSLRGSLVPSLIAPSTRVRSGASVELTLELRNESGVRQPIAVRENFDIAQVYMKTFDAAGRDVTIHPEDSCGRFGSASLTHRAFEIDGGGVGRAQYKWIASSLRGVESNAGGKSRCTEASVPLSPGKYTVKVPLWLVEGHQLPSDLALEIEVVP